MNSDLYLKHDLYTKDDDKIIELCNTTGAAGYGLYWATVEVLYSCDNHKIGKKDLAKNLSRRFLMFDEDGCPRVPEEIGRFIEYIGSPACSLFIYKDGAISSKRVLEACKEHEEFLKKQEEFLKKQSEKGKKGNEVRWDKNRSGNRKTVAVGNRKTIAVGNRKTIAVGNRLDKQEQEQEQDNICKKEAEEKSKETSAAFFITLVDGSTWKVPEEYIASKQQIYPELDASKVFMEIATASKFHPTKRPLIQNINGFIASWFENTLNHKKAENNKKKVGDQFTDLKDKLESQKNEAGGFDL